MRNSIRSKPKGSGEAAQLNQQPAALSRKQFDSEHQALAQTSQERLKELLSRKEVAQRWSCCPHTIARRKDLKPVRFNRRFLRYRLADIEAVEAAAAA